MSAVRFSPSANIFSRNGRSSTWSNTSTRGYLMNSGASARSWAAALCSPDPSCEVRTWQRRWRMKRRPDSDAAPPATSDTPFFITYLPIYLDYVAVEKGLAKNSLASYRHDLRRFGHWLQDQRLDLERVERSHLTRYFQALRTTGISARSVARALAGIRGFFRFLVSEQHLQRDPTENLERPKLWSTLPNSLQPSEVDALLADPDRTKPAGLRDAAMLELLYATGLRVSELIRVKVEDLVLDASFLRTMGKGSRERV